MPTAAHAAPLIGNAWYAVGPSSGGFRAYTGNTHSAGSFLDLAGRSNDVVRDFTTSTTYPVNTAYAGPPSEDVAADNRSFTQTFATTPLAFTRIVAVEGDSEATSLVRVTLRVQNVDTVEHRIGVSTAVTDDVDGDDSPVFVPWRGTATKLSVHDASPSYKQFDLLNDSQAPSRGAFPTIRSTWSVARPDLGTTTPDVVDQESRGLAPTTNFSPANTAGQDLSTGSASTVWTWGPDSASATTLAPGASRSYVIAMVAEKPDAAPVNTTLPTIAGTPAIGATLSSDTGTWSTITPFTQYDRQWLRCDADGEACVAIPGATGASYTPTAADAGKVIRLDVTADRGPTVRSAKSAPLPAAAATPVATATPVTTPVPAAPGTTAKRKGAKATVLFPSSSARLTGKARRALRKLAKGRTTTARLTCVGYTASANGRSTYRRTLGLRRAKAVCAFLARRVDATKVVTTTKAGADPVASNRTRSGRARNRRVTVTIA